MKKILLLISIMMIFTATVCGCSSNTSESTMPTLDQTVKSRDGDKVVFFEGEKEETISPSMETFNNIYFRISNGDLLVALDDGQYYRTTISGVDGLFVDVRSEDQAVVGDLYIFRGNRILYKITFYSGGYEPFLKEDLETAFGKLTPVK